MKITYKWFIAPLALVVVGLVMKAAGSNGETLTTAGRLCAYVGGMSVSFLLVAWAVTGALRQK